MSAISTWDGDDASNNDSAAPDGFPEGQLPSSLNNSCREVMRAVRSQWEQAEWLDWGHTPTFASASSFTVAGNETAVYLQNRRIKIEDSSTLYGTISSSSYSNPNTTINVTLDSGSITAGISSVELGILSPTNDALPRGLLMDLSSAQTVAGVKTFSAEPVFNAGIGVPDGQYLDMGDADDFTIGHDGTDNKITGTGGDVYLESLVDSSDVIIRNNDSGSTTRTVATFGGDNSQAIFYYGGTETMRVVANGITFNGDTAAANTLRDYEHGTWTGTLEDGSANSATMGASVTGNYIKIGAFVHVQIKISTTSVSTLTTDLRITGLPFAAAGACPGTVSCANAALLNLTSGQSVTGSIPQSQSYILLYVWDDAAGQTAMSGTQWSDDGEAIFSGGYFTTS